MRNTVGIKGDPIPDHNEWHSLVGVEEIKHHEIGEWCPDGGRKQGYKSSKEGVVRDAFLEEVASQLRLVEVSQVEEEVSAKSRNSMCKGPEVQEKHTHRE